LKQGPRRRDRHRLHRGGNRQLNRALHVIAITRGRIDPQTRAYLARKEAEGKSRIEAMRCLKRHVARHYHQLLLRPPGPRLGSPVIAVNAATSMPYGDVLPPVGALPWLPVDKQLQLPGAGL
jgi:hypothetical protein